jgi:hypothetical protein
MLRRAPAVDVEDQQEQAGPVAGAVSGSAEPVRLPCGVSTGKPSRIQYSMPPSTTSIVYSSPLPRRDLNYPTR